MSAEKFVPLQLNLGLQTKKIKNQGWTMPMGQPCQGQRSRQQRREEKNKIAKKKHKKLFGREITFHTQWRAFADDK